MARILEHASGSGNIGAGTAAARTALRLLVTGVVQGVGFRPFVCQLALRHRLGGWVRNAGSGVHIEIEGTVHEVEAFVQALYVDTPPLARIDDIRSAPTRAAGRTTFAIAHSTDDDGDSRQPVAPDVAICARCEAELFDPSNRRYRYPFITCTDCGPRFTVIEAMPYDRERTSMRMFRQCAACAAEYVSPEDRRYRSETNSCAACGPMLWLAVCSGVAEATGEAALTAAAARLERGEIVAIRGLGGFHLAADATNDAAVARLRARKQRGTKPFAVMVRTVADAAALGAVGPAERALLGSAERPIVLLERHVSTPLAFSIAPGLRSVGVMVAYTPLHHLLLEHARRPLVMTSGNVTDEPIATGNAEALDQLNGIADAWLLHDREVVSRYDDSVARASDSAPMILRRARGYAPLPLDLPVATPRPLVAVGPHLKNTFTLVQGSTAYVSQHVGDLESLETLEHFGAAYDRYRSLFRIEPEIAVRDLHPGYLSTRVALELGLARTIQVQHHHAHVAAVMAEHGVTSAVVGVAFDGAGWGDDGTVWGGEFLVADLHTYRRVAHLRPAPLPGGEATMRYPWRSALGYLSLEPSAADAFTLAFGSVEQRERAAAERQIARETNSPMASSMGRLFDAAAAVLGVRSTVEYEGQAAMELEALAGYRPAVPLPFPELDPLPLLTELGERRLRGEDVGDLAAAFHESVAAATADTAARIAAAADINMIALGGGVFQNTRLLSSICRRLKSRGLTVLTPHALGPNDGAISFGQAAVAAARLGSEPPG